MEAIRTPFPNVWSEMVSEERFRNEWLCCFDLVRSADAPLDPFGPSYVIRDANGPEEREDRRRLIAAARLGVCFPFPPASLPILGLRLPLRGLLACIKY